MLLTFLIMTFFGICVLYDTYKHKKDRKPAARLMMTVMGIVSLVIAITNLAGFLSDAGMM